MMPADLRGAVPWDRFGVEIGLPRGPRPGPRRDRPSESAAPLTHFPSQRSPSMSPRLLRVGWFTVVLLMALPTLVLLGGGSWWLFRERLLWFWLALTGVSVLLSWWLSKWLRRRHGDSSAGTVQPEGTWTPLDQQAWERVERLARDMQDSDLDLESPEALWTALHAILHEVAAVYYPRSQMAELETPLPHVARIVELVAGDLREMLAERVPASHMLTLRDFTRLGRFQALYRQFYLLYRVVQMGINPVAAVVREVRDAFNQQAVGASTGELRRFAIGFCVRKAGFYAIQLYGGRLLLDDKLPGGEATRRSRDDEIQADRRDERLRAEPLRVLIVGQVKSGKSSLVNALFGEARAAVDVIPRTAGIEPYVLARDGMPAAILIDTAGYEAATSSEEAFRPLEKVILTCDLVILVCAAVSASRESDRRLLDRIREFFAERPDRIMPPRVVAVTHVDRLRPFTEWDPPYDVVRPQGDKARHIREALDAVREDLALGLSEPLVPVCLHPDRPYNVAEGLAPAVLQVVPAAERTKYVRCLRQHRDEDFWRRLWHQAVNSGRLLRQAGAEWLQWRRS